MIISAFSAQAADFKTQIVEIVIPASDDSIDVTSPSAFDSVDPNSTIALISGVTQHAMGWTQATNQDPVEISATVELIDSNTLRATRSSSSIAQTNTIFVLLIEYIGAVGGDNEFIVRDRRVNSWSSGTTTDSYGSISSVTDVGDVVVFNSGTENPNTGNNQYDRGDVRAFIDSNKNVQLRRGDGNGAIESSHQVVEFTGSNWDIQSGSATPAQHDPASGPSVGGTDVTINDVGDVTNSWVYFNWQTNRANLDERGHRVFLTSTTNLRVQEHAAATAAKTIQWYVITNPEMTVQTGAADDQFSSLTTTTITGFSAVNDISSSFAWVSGMTNGGGNAHPRDMWQFELSSTSTVSLERGRNGQNLDYHYFVVELPDTVIDTQPIANPSANPTSGLEPLNVQFNGTFTSGDAPFTFLWDFDDGTNSTLQNPNNVFSAGTYNVSFTVTDNDGDSDTEFVIITVDQDLMPTANADANPTSGQEPLNVQFNGTGTGGNAPLTYFWDFDDGTNSTAEDPSHTFTVSGTYNVTLTVTDNDGDQDSDVVTITVSADTQPIANPSANPTSGLEPLNVSFIGSFTSGDAPFTFFWDFDDGTNSTLQNPSHVLSAGTYNVSFTVTDNDGDSDTEFVIITVDQDLVPIANASATPVSGNATLNVTFSGNFVPGNPSHTFFWNFGDGFNSTLQNPVHAYTNPGVFNATFTVTDNDLDSDSDVVVITVN